MLLDRVVGRGWDAGRATAQGVVALVVYERVGLGILRRAWVNVDMVWAVALVAAGAFTLFG
ncbi:MAG: hypothetical protein ACRDZ9_00965 [Acidimicrobiales bacterium]